MAKYRVTAEMYPGAYRAGVGFFGPGQEFEMPDDERPNRGLVPVDAAAVGAFKLFWGEDRKGEDQVAEEKPNLFAPMSVKQAAAEADGRPEKQSKRAADR